MRYTEWRPLYWKIGWEYARLDEVDPKLRKLLLQYGMAFDDEWVYHLAGKGRYVHRHKHTWVPKELYEWKHKY